MSTQSASFSLFRWIHVVWWCCHDDVMYNVCILNTVSVCFVLVQYVKCTHDFLTCTLYMKSLPDFFCSRQVIAYTIIIISIIWIKPIIRIPCVSCVTAVFVVKLCLRHKVAAATLSYQLHGQWGSVEVTIPPSPLLRFCCDLILHVLLKKVIRVLFWYHCIWWSLTLILDCVACCACLHLFRYYMYLVHVVKLE